MQALVRLDKRKTKVLWLLGGFFPGVLRGGGSRGSSGLGEGWTPETLGETAR